MNAEEQILDYFTRMLRARRFDEVLCDHGAYVNDTYHVSIGLETSAAAIACAQEKGDSILLNHRNHGQLAACGASPELMYREIFGRDGGSQRGKLGSFHLIDVEHGIAYVSAMLAGGVPLSIGMALANKRIGNGSISFAYLGDGAMDEGIVYESFNIASAWHVPVVIVCDNNGSRPRGGQSKFSILAEVCGLTAFKTDAQNPLDVFSTVAMAAAGARKGEEPQFVEIVSEPWPGNATGSHPQNITGPFDLATAHSRSDEWSVVDPLVHMVRLLRSRGVSLDVMAEIDSAIKGELAEAVGAALGAPLAPESVIFEHVWGDQ